MFCNYKKESCPDQFADKVKCDDCRCWMDKSDAKRLEVSADWLVYDEYYCQAHKKPYSRTKRYYLKDTAIWKFFAEVEVNESGVPIKNPTK